MGKISPHMLHCLPAFFTVVGSFASVRTEMASQFANFNASVIAQRTAEWFLVRVNVAIVSRQFATGYERHGATWRGAFIGLGA